MRNIITLPQTVGFFVPTTVNGNEPAPQAIIDKALNLVMSTMIGLHGGCHVVQAQGGFKLASGQIVVENVFIVRSNTSNSHDETMFDLAETICDMMTQESVAVDINGTLHLVGMPNRLSIAA